LIVVGIRNKARGLAGTNRSLHALTHRYDHRLMLDEGERMKTFLARSRFANLFINFFPTLGEK